MFLNEGKDQPLYLITAADLVLKFLKQKKTNMIHLQRDRYSYFSICCLIFLKEDQITVLLESVMYQGA